LRKPEDEPTSTCAKADPVAEAPAANKKARRACQRGAAEADALGAASAAGVLRSQSKHMVCK
jgi:hypothetical protein